MTTSHHTDVVTGAIPTGQPDTGLVHGRHSTYTHRGCRCTGCTLAATAWSAARRRQVAYGRWQPFVAAEPVRLHAQALVRAGMNWQQIAGQAGVSEKVLRRLLVGGGGQPPSVRMREENARAIQSVAVPRVPPTGRAFVDGTGARRRLQALVAAGWPIRVLARLGETHGEELWRLAHGRRPRITSSRARLVHELYDRLWATDPADHGVRTRDRTGALAIAARHGWAVPLAWDDDTIDDPAATPDWTARCGTPGGYYDHSQIGTPTCPRCRRAVRDAARERKLRRRARAA